MKRRVTLLAFGVFFLALSVQDCLAELSYTLHPTFKVSQEVTDNLFLTSDAEETEWITLVSPGIEFQAEGKNSLTHLSYEPGFTFYHSNDELNEVRHRVNLSYEKGLSRRTRFSLSNRFLQTEAPLNRGGALARSDPDSDAVDFTQQRGREERITNTALARLDHQFGPVNTWYLQHRYRFYKDDNLGAEDRQEHSPAAGLTYRIAERTDLKMNLEYTRADFSADGRADIVQESDSFDEWDGQLQILRAMTKFFSVFAGYRHTYVNYEGDETDYHVFSPAVGAEYRFTKWGTASVGLGYFVQDFDEVKQAENGFTERDNNEGLVLNTEIDMEWEGRRWGLGVQVLSGYEQASIGSNNTGLTIFYGGHLSASYAMTRHLDVTASTEYRYYDYQDDQSVRVSEGGSQEWEQIWALKAGLDYQLTPRLTLDLKGKHEVVLSNRDFDEYTENSAIFSLTYRPQGYKF